MKFYPHHIGDYNSATAHLSNEEDICYRRLLDRYYDSEQPLDNDTALLARKVRSTVPTVQTILVEFFYLSDGKWHHHKCDEIIAGWYAKSVKAQASANARWAKRERNANAMRTHTDGNADRCEQDATQYPIPNTKINTILSNPAGFDEFWSAYPKKIGKAKAMSVWKKLKVNGNLKTVLGAISAQKQSEQWLKDGGQFIPHPATWLSQGRWEDEVSGTTAGSNPYAGMI